MDITALQGTLVSIYQHFQLCLAQFDARLLVRILERGMLISASSLELMWHSRRDLKLPVPPRLLIFVDLTQSEKMSSLKLRKSFHNWCNMLHCSMDTFFVFLINTKDRTFSIHV